MSHEIETMAYVKRNEADVPWHTLGTPVGEEMTSEGALSAAELTWKVESKPIYVDGIEIPNYRANVRDSDRSVFGVVSDRYKIVQNTEAFAFTDYLLRNDLGIPVKYETAGSLEGGKRVWLLAHLPPERVLGDQIIPYLVFTNSHDGKGAVRIAVTPTRVVCSNTLNIALTSAQRVWSARHMGDMGSKMKDAEDTLLRTAAYMKDLNENAEIMQQKKITEDILNEFLSQVFPVSEIASERQQMNIAALKFEVVDYFKQKEDLKPFANTAWGLYNALADFECHSTPQRVTTSFRERRFTNLVDGNSRLLTAEKFLLTM